MSIRKSRVGLIVASSLLVAFLCESARAATPLVYTLHIEAQPLDRALQTFARETGMQILFLSRLTDGRRSRALDGKYPLDTALRILLSDSNLTYRMINAKTIEIVSEPRS